MHVSVKGFPLGINQAFLHHIFMSHVVAKQAHWVSQNTKKEQV